MFIKLEKLMTVDEATPKNLYKRSDAPLFTCKFDCMPSIAVLRNVKGIFIHESQGQRWHENSNWDFGWNLVYYVGRIECTSSQIWLEKLQLNGSLLILLDHCLNSKIGKFYLITAQIWVKLNQTHCPNLQSPVIWQGLTKLKVKICNFLCSF